MISEKIINNFRDIEEKNYLLRKKAFELIKFSAEIDEKLEQIANEIYYEEEIIDNDEGKM
jgi:hypothetical protein